jgi:Xaa-Pro aminopeptidase
MRYEPIDNKLFIANREKIIKSLKPGSIAILVSNDLMPKGADGFFPFRQNPDMFYLTGVDQEETFLVLFPDAPLPEWKEILFVRETNATIAMWEGEKLSKPQATHVSGIKNIQWSHNFDKMLPAMMFEAKQCYLNTNEHARYSSEADYAELRFERKIKSQYPLHTYERLAPLMHQARAVKHEVEIALMKHACDITRKGFDRVLHFVKPGVMEYDIEAELTHEFLRNGSRGHAYEPIIASGKNACVLHYVVNDKVCSDGELILLDFGAEYAGYASDLTRCVPVSGRFSARQKEVYNAVLRVFHIVKNNLRPEKILKDNLAAAQAAIEKECVDLGLITMDEIKNQDPANPLYKRYFNHGVSHFLGIDVHDVGNHYKPIAENMIFTCEPGIYIKEEGIGVRIEGDMLITSGAPIDLLGEIPIEVEEIEEIMSRRAS